MNVPCRQQWNASQQALTGALGEILDGLTAIWGPPIMMLFVMLKLDKDDWVQTVGLVWFVGSVPLT